VDVHLSNLRRKLDQAAPDAIGIRIGIGIGIGIG
jgi:DNA-binding response OmpR family regulator